MKYFLWINLVIFLGCRPDYDLPKKQREEIPYDNKPLTTLYVDYLCSDPMKTGLPVIIFIHGGGWNTGDKSDVGLIPDWLVDNNFVSVTVNYSLAPFPIDMNTPPIYPQNIQDIANSINWVKCNISRYGGNPEEIYIIGHSAGAHLAALVVTDQHFLNKLNFDIVNIKGVILLDAAGYLDLNSTYFADIEGNSNRDNYCKDLHKAFQNAFGTPDMTTYRNAIPYFHLSEDKILPSFLLIHSDVDYRRIPNIIFEKRIIEQGFQCKRAEIVGRDHMYFSAVIGTSDTIISSLVKKFIVDNK